MKRILVKKPWGNFKQFTLNEKSTVKILTIKPKQILSLQKHKKRKEFWYFLDNEAIVTSGNRKIKVKKNDTIIIKKGQKHRIQALSKIVSVLEISFGEFDEKDIIRFDDIYGRK